MRPARTLYLLVACLVVEPNSAYSQQKTIYLGNQGRIDGLKLTSQGHRKLLTPGIHNHVRAHLTLAPPKVGQQKSSTTTETILPKQDNVLPGLPSALIAVVEGGPPGVAASLPSARPPAPAQSPTSSKQPVFSMPSSPSSTSGPVSLTATASNNTDPTTRGLFLPFEAGVGAAAFSRGDDILVVFDAARPLDLSIVQTDTIGARSSIQLLPEATVLRLPGQRNSDLVLRRFPTGWLIQANGSTISGKTIDAVMEGAALKLSMDSPGRTVVVPDPQTGGNLLVGTVLEGGTAVRVRRHGVAEIIEQTLQGVVIDPLSDRLELHPTKGAFLLSGIGTEGLDTIPVIPNVDGRGGVVGHRVMSLAAGSAEALHRRFRDAKAAAAAAPVGARFAPRLLAAQDALALGDAAQATAIAHVALADDAREAGAPLSQLVIAAAALLDHHSNAADLLDDTRAIPNGEIELWRAVKLAEQNPASSEAARLFAVNLPLLRSYPAPVQAILMPIAAESLVRSGSDAQAALVDHLPAENDLTFAKAILAERRGQTSVALAILDHLASDQDVRLADKAVEEAVAIRERLPSADPKKLAEILEAHLLDARIGEHEVSSRFHLFELLTQSKQYRKALQLLRETASFYPEQKTEVRRRIGELLRNLATAPLPGRDEDALDQAAMIETNADMLPDGADGSRVSLFLAARLMALDLPERALPIVRDMMHAAKSGSDKAELGLKLASLDFQENDLEGVQTALRESDPGDLPADRMVPRLIMTARAFAGSGQIDQALAALAPLKTDAALDLKASLLSHRGDWSGTTDTLLALAEQGHLPTGKISEAGQDMLLRLASAASHTKDKARIDHVKALGNGRFSDSGKAALFHLLTSDPASDDADMTKLPSETAAIGHTSEIFNSISR